jgi:hypothetical protein
MSAPAAQRRLVVVSGDADTRREHADNAYLRLYTAVYGRRERRVRGGCGRRRRRLYVVP